MSETPDPVFGLLGEIVADTADYSHDARSARPAPWSGPDVDEVVGRAHDNAVYDHPKYGAVVDALRRDPALEALRPDDRGREPFVHSRQTGGSRLHFDLLGLELVKATVLEVVARRLAGDAANLQAVLGNNLAKLRAAASGRSVTTTLLIGFAGLNLDPLDPLQTPWGLVHDAGDLLAMPQLSILGKRDDKATAYLVREADVHYQIDFADNPRIQPGPDRVDARVSKALLLLPLALLLGTAVGDHMAPVGIWTSGLIPWSAGFSAGSWKSFGPPARRTTVLGREEATGAQDWAALVDNRFSPRLETAATRLMSAAGRRAEPRDVLIDSITVWESLVGGTPETTFRVTAALAKLLKPNLASRLSTRRELSKLYGLRSKAVHGESDARNEISKAAPAALEVAVSALSAVLKREGLTGLTASQRAEQLILE